MLDLEHRRRGGKNENLKDIENQISREYVMDNKDRGGEQRRYKQLVFLVK